MDKARQVSPSDIAAAISSLQRRLQESGSEGAPQRLDCSPESIEQGLARLVLSLIELLRRLLERQAIRRMEGGSITDQEIENMGEALMKLEAKIQELAGLFGLTMADLNLDLGPLGNLLEK
ncbi:MAG TPA: gas vesicle protein K [Terriglobales bacterium]|nr:gas vesicle protein K [Terriglobales bacterium]